MTVEAIADEIYRELDQPSDASIPAISFWLTSNIGKLNNLIDEDFTVVSSEISPEIGITQTAILKTLYFIYYYQRKMNQNLGAAAYVSVSEVKEGNRTVKRTNKTEIAKTYKGLVDDYKEELMGQVLNYKMNLADPAHVIVGNPIIEEDYSLYPFADRDSNRYDLY